MQARQTEVDPLRLTHPIRLGVNIDHVATLRQARRAPYPDPLLAALVAEQSGADSITLHLREDRRHIQDHDVERMRASLQTRMNLEMAATDAMIEIARRVTLADVARGDALTSPDAVRDYLRLVLGPETVEVFVGLFLDSQHRLISAEELARGTLAQTSVYPREVVKTALARNAAAVIFAHNHPSGVAEPSRADELLTQSLKSALSLVDVRTLDHLVVAGPRVTSFAERGLL